MSTRVKLRRALAGMAMIAVAIGGTAITATAAPAASLGSTVSSAPPAATTAPASPTNAVSAVLAPSPSPGGGQTGQPNEPAVAARVAAWVAQGGAKHLTALGADFGALEKAASAADMTNMGASCGRLRTDVATAQVYAPIPDATAEVHWASALNHYARGSVACINGAGAANAELISRAADQIMAGSADLDQVTTRLNQIAGR